MKIDIEITRGQCALHIVQLIFCLIMVLIVAILMCYLADIGCEWWQMATLCVGLLYFTVKAVFSLVFLAFVQWVKNKAQNDEQND